MRLPVRKEIDSDRGSFQAFIDLFLCERILFENNNIYFLLTDNLM